MPVYRYTTDEVMPVVEHIGGMLQGIPPHLSMAACLLLAYTMVKGTAPPKDKVGEMVDDFSTLMSIWEQETIQ